MSIPTLCAANGSRLAHLSSLRTVSVLDLDDPERSRAEVEVAIEPSFVAVGGKQVAVGMNNHCWFYHTQPVKGPNGRPLPPLASEKEYLGSVRALSMNDTYAAALVEGKCHLHLIAPPVQTGRGAAPEERENKVFPEKDDSEVQSDAHATRTASIYYIRVVLSTCTFLHTRANAVAVRIFV